MLGGEVADGFVQADHPLLHDVVAIGADQEVRATLDPGKAAVPGEQLVDSLFVSGPKQRHEVLVRLGGEVSDQPPCGHGRATSFSDAPSRRGRTTRCAPSIMPYEEVPHARIDRRSK